MASNNRTLVPEARQALDNMKMQVASELGVNLKGYNGDLSSRQNGSIGGEMVRRIIHQYEQQVSNRV